MSMARVAVAAAALTSLACLTSCKPKRLPVYDGELKLEHILSDGIVSKQEYDRLNIDEKAKLTELLGGDLLSFNDNEPVLLNEKQTHLAEKSSQRIQQVNELKLQQVEKEEKSTKLKISGLFGLMIGTIALPMLAGSKRGKITDAVVLSASIGSFVTGIIMNNKAKSANSQIGSILSNSYSDYFVVN